MCVNAHETYVKARREDGVYILAEALVKNVLGEDVEIMETFSGADLVGTEYEPLFDMSAGFGGKKGYRVVADNYVTLDEGTGVVHIAPAFGEDDNRVGKIYDLPFLQLVNTSGHMCGGTPFDGLFVKDADKPVLEDLKRQEKLFSAPQFEHSYPFCWRCDTPLIYYAREEWFIRMTAVKEGHPLPRVGLPGLRQGPRDGQQGGAKIHVPGLPGGYRAPQALHRPGHRPVPPVRRAHEAGERSTRSPSCAPSAAGA